MNYIFLRSTIVTSIPDKEQRNTIAIGRSGAVSPAAGDGSVASTSMTLTFLNELVCPFCTAFDLLTADLAEDDLPAVDFLVFDFNCRYKNSP